MSCSRQYGKQLVLGRLVEDVVDHLHAVDEPGVERAQHVGRLPAVDADAEGADQASRASDRRPPAASRRRPPTRRSRRGTAAGRSSRRRGSRGSSRCTRGCASGGKISSTVYSACAGHFMFFGGILVATTIGARRGCARSASPSSRSLLPVAVGPGGVEEVAAERDRPVERAQRLLVVGSGPAAHAPHAVADLGDLPAGAAERAIAHTESCHDYVCGALGRVEDLRGARGNSRQRRELEAMRLPFLKASPYPQARRTFRWTSTPGSPGWSWSSPSSTAAAPSPRPATAASAPCAAPRRG